MIPQYEPMFNVAELNTNFVSYFESGGWMTEYKKTEEFENKIKEFLGVKHCSVVNNGTISLSLALLAGGIEPGDEVLVPNLTMIATANAVRLIGARPVFVDVSPDNLCMDLFDAFQKITTKTKAFIYVTLNGRSQHTTHMNNFCIAHKLLYISDDAQSFGSEYSDNTKIGTSGDISSFSFSMPKIITTGQGGCLVTNNDVLAKRIKKLKDFGRTGGGIDIHNEFGINSKFTELQSILGLSQINNIEERVFLKKQIYAIYLENLKNVKEISFIDTDLDTVTPWFVDIYVKNKLELMEYLKRNNINTRAVYSPLNEQECYSNYPEYYQTFMNSRIYSERGLWLPSSMTLLEKDIVFICDKIKDFYARPI